MNKQSCRIKGQYKKNCYFYVLATNKWKLEYNNYHLQQHKKYRDKLNKVSISPVTENYKTLLKLQKT